MNYSVFSADELDNPSEMSKAVEEKNNKFEADVIRPFLEKFEEMPCSCNFTGSGSGKVKTLGVNGEVIEIDESDVPVNGIVLTPVDTDESKEDGIKAENPTFNYSVIVRSVDNEYKSLVAAIRSCPKCGDIKIRGDLDEITKTFGIAYVNLIDYETKHGGGNEEAAPVTDACDCSSCDDCAACESAARTMILDDQVVMADVVDVQEEEAKECEE